MNNSFSKFENFGAIADIAKRKQLAQSIYEELTKGKTNGTKFTVIDSENFGAAIEAILANSDMKELTRQDPELAEKVTLEILDFINKAKKQIITSENPFKQEQDLLNSFKETEKTKFKEQWNTVSTFIKNGYPKRQIDCAFYSEEFRKSFDKKTGGKDQVSYESVREHFAEKWEQLLFQKQTGWQLSIIDKWRKKVTQELYKRIEELKKLQELLAPFTSELGRLFDMSKGRWQRANFDILKRYADFLQHDKDLQQLAEMLGKLQQAEKEFEEEFFTNVVIKPDCKTEYASKSDLVGIRESDDLSSLLPGEIALLSDPTLESVFMKKFAEKKLQTFEYRSKILSFREEEFQDKRQREKEDTKGPFIICVDTSASMQGTPETVAKSLCFAILKIALREKRKCFLISFSTGVETLNLADLKNSLGKVMEFLSMSFHGGTDAEPAIKEALQMLETKDYSKADVLMITDGIMSQFKKDTKEKIEKVKSSKTKFHALVVGDSANQELLADFDNNWLYDPDNPESVIKLIKNLKEI